MFRWVLPGLSLSVGVGIGVAMTTAGVRRESVPRGGLIDRLPVIPIPSVDAAELLPGTGSGNGSTAAVKYGFPSLSHIKSREAYVTAYDPRNRTAAWVIERMDAGTVTGSADRKFCDFKEDDSVHVYHRSTNADYRGSGFDRGHMAAAANHKWSQRAMEETFYLSNVAPQNPHLNQNAWNNLEKYCRSLTKHYTNVFVCTGPLYLPRQEADGKMYVKYQVLGKNHVAVPTHFFKVLILESAAGPVELRSYVFPNAAVDDKLPLQRFLVPIESVEKSAGLLFIPNILRRNTQIRAITAP